MRRNNYPNAYRSRPACKDGYSCRYFGSNRCRDVHTEQHKHYIEVAAFLYRAFQTNKKLILGTVNKLEDERFKLTPLNQEIKEKYPDLHFIVENPQAKTLSKEYYYEARYQFKESKDGEFFVNIIEERDSWGKVGKADEDIEALFYGHAPIYKDNSHFTGDFKIGILKEKFDERIVLRCDSSKTDYIFPSKEHQNRALVGDTVQFLEIEDKHNHHNRSFKNMKEAQVAAIVKSPFDKDYLYGILEPSVNASEQIDVKSLFSPLSKDIDCILLEKIFMKTGGRFTSSLSKSTITIHDFKDVYSRILNVDQEDPSLIHLGSLIFKDPTCSQELSIVKKAWNSIQELLYRWKEIKGMQTCYFRPLNKNLPMFQCIYVQKVLEENQDVWKNYIKAAYTHWPASSEYPWIVIDDIEGAVGDDKSDSRVILSRNKVTTDRFSKRSRSRSKKSLKAGSLK